MGGRPQPLPRPLLERLQGLLQELEAKELWTPSQHKDACVDTHLGDEQ